MHEQRYRGTVASSGLADGAIFVFRPPAVVYGTSTGSNREAGLLRDAIGRAGSAIGRAMHAANMQELAILEFHRALIEDETLWQPAFAAIEAGAGALAACIETMNAEAAGFSSHSSPDFRARADDIVDVRDRVCASLGNASGDALLPAPSSAPPGSIFVAAEMGVATFLAIDWSGGGGIVLQNGSLRGHLALLCRTRKIPLLVQVDGDLDGLSGRALVDGEFGEFIVAPTAATVSKFQAQNSRILNQTVAPRGGRQIVARDGQPVSVMFNIAQADEVESLPHDCAGIGLVRTEFLFNDHPFAGEDVQFEVYKALLMKASGKPVVIRLFDFGGDKPAPPGFGFPISPAGAGPRGIRLLRQNPSVLAVQLRALVRACAFGNLRILVPMVSDPEEIDFVRRVVADQRAALLAQGFAAGTPMVGMMVEVPVAAMSLETFDADFYALGTNDLVQFLTASDRADATSDAHADLCHPAILRLVETVIAHAHDQGKEICCCGDAAADPRTLRALLTAGIRSISVPPLAFEDVKAVLSDRGGPP